jgi:hypothetical protein
VIGAGDDELRRAIEAVVAVRPFRVDDRDPELERALRERQAIDSEPNLTDPRLPVPTQVAEILLARPEQRAREIA